MNITKFYLLRQTIYAYISIIPKRENRLRINTNINVDKSFWDVKRCRVKHQVSNSNEINIKLDEFEKSVNKSYKVLLDKYGDLTSRPADEIKQEFMNLFTKVKENKSSNQFFDVFDLFLESKINAVAFRTYYKKELIKRLLLEYQTKTGEELTFNAINSSFKVRFEKFLISKNYSDNYISKIFSVTREFMLFALKNKHHSSLDFKELSKAKKPIDIITLTEFEVQQVINADITSSTLSRARDLFLLQLELVQRHSDMQNLTKQSFYKDVNDNLICKIRQMKTDTVVDIPLSKLAVSIVQKYDYDIPKIVNQKFNVYIKAVCKIAGINDLTNITTYKSGKKIVESKPKYELISSHTARRTGATLLVESNVPITAVMQLTGHKTMSEFQKYVGKTSLTGLIQALANSRWDNDSSNLKLVKGA